MRCPNCGSTAQYKLTRKVEVDGYLYLTYTCGCGATAERVYRIESFNITPPNKNRKKT